MRKKSHISLAVYIVNNLQANELQKHRKAFYLGSILPDCKPSFLTTKHEITGTFDMVSAKIAELCALDLQKVPNMRVYCRDLGQVIHYIADYFTFPHNQHYPGSLKDHCVYEEELKLALREYIKSGKATEDQKVLQQFSTPQELCEYIKAQHGYYASQQSDVANDIFYIVAMTYQVVAAIWQLTVQTQFTSLACA